MTGIVILNAAMVLVAVLRGPACGITSSTAGERDWGG
jgi:hypothetical protein